MIYKTIDEVVKYMHYWQARYFDMKQERDYYRQQLKDKEAEMKAVLGVDGNR